MRDYNAICYVVGIDTYYKKVIDKYAFGLCLIHIKKIN